MELADPTAFAQMYDEHASAVFGTALRVLGDRSRAQDVTHDVFLRVWRSPQRYDAGRGPLGPYLRLMARSRALDLYREDQAAGRARDRLAVVADRDEDVVDARPAAAAERGELRGVVRRALGSLPEAQREAIVLAYWGGLTAVEIARRCGVPVGTAKSRIRLGLSHLRAEVDAPALTAAA
jgi:RNA polymerase sigma-70 factor, ECF subfamily